MTDHATPDARPWARPAVQAIVGLILAALIVAGLISNGVRLAAAQEAAQRLEVHTYQVIVASKDFLTTLEDTETGQRGFLLTGRSEYLEPFRRGVVAAPATLDKLEALTRDNPLQNGRVRGMQAPMTERLALSTLSVQRAAGGDVTGGINVVREGRGKWIMDDLRGRIGVLLAEEHRLLDRRSAVAQSNARAARLALYLLALAGLLLLAAAGVAVVIATRAAARLRVADVERRAADEQRQARDFLQTVIDGALDPIFVKDRQGQFLLANTRTASIYGVESRQMIGRRDRDLLTADVAELLEATDRRVMESGVAEVLEERLPENGQWRTFFASKAPWLRNGEVIGVIGVSQDITDRKRAEDAVRELNDQLEARVETRTREIERAETQIRQMQKMESIGQLTGGIAHDFNNMLAIIIGSLDLAERRMDKDPAKARACITNAQEGAQRAATLTSRLLAFSRQQALEPEPIDANKLVGGMSELLRRTIGDHVRVETVLAGGLWRTVADAGELENALLNLCVNARDAMPDGGRLTVETQNAHLDDAYVAQNQDATAGQYVLICVSDTGGGMPPEVIDRAFDPFYTTKSVGKGTGLGLSQVYGFIKQSGGHIKIYSEVGHGTTVKVYLPRYFGPDAPRAAAPAREAPVARGQATEIILVVEDEGGVRTFSVDALRELGYTVIHTDGGAEALEMLKAHPGVRLLFTDIMMPGMNGRQLADQAVAGRPDLKVLYTTGYTRNAVVHNGVLDPGVAFLPKPFTLDQLAAKIRQVLDT